MKTGKEMLLIPQIVGRGYLNVSLCRKGRKCRKLIHRLVAEAFIPNPDNFPCVNHKDENKQNNCVWNLEWCSYSYNNSYNEIAKKRMKKHSIKIKCLDLKTNEITYYSSSRDAAKSLNTKHRVILYSLHKATRPYKNRYIFSEIKNEIEN